MQGNPRLTPEKFSSHSPLLSRYRARVTQKDFCDDVTPRKVLSKDPVGSYERLSREIGQGVDNITPLYGKREGEDLFLQV